MRRSVVLLQKQIWNTFVWFTVVWWVIFKTNSFAQTSTLGFKDIPPYLKHHSDVQRHFSNCVILLSAVNNTQVVYDVFFALKFTALS